MNVLNKEQERFDVEALLPWHAAGTLSRRDADRVEQALASDRELQRRYALVREEFAETIHLNESLGAPSPRAMEKLFAAIDAEEARAPRRRASFDFAGRISEFISGFAPRTLAWSASRRRARDPRAGSRDHHRGGQGPERAGRHRSRQQAERRLLRDGPFRRASDRGRHHQLPGRPQGIDGRGTRSRAASTRSSSPTASLRPTRSARSSSRCRKS